MEDWIFISVFHNLSISKRVESKYVIITSHDDHLTQAIRDRSPAFSQFVDNFKDQFGRPFAPSLFFLHKNVKPDLEAIISFRNLFTISSIVQSWEKFLCLDAQSTQLDYYKFSNYFDLYAYSLSKNEKNIIANTPFFGNLDEPDKFQGQCSPEIAKAYPTSNFYDSVLFKALSKEWEKYFVSRKRKEWKSRSLFRSLEMAFRATGIPFENKGTIHDYGANIALWISAFEILVHPENGNINIVKVLDFLGNIHFKTKELNYKKYRRRKDKNKNEQLNLIQKTYFEMYNARNQFLHGNPVKSSDLFPGQNSKYNSFTAIAPVLYKCALYHFLGLLELDSNKLTDIIQDNIRRRDLETALVNSRELRRNYRRRKKKS
jgi:hypothetical protein